jgi:proline racemase
MQRVEVVDSHTGGEPTRVVLGGGPELGSGALAERALRLRTEFDHWRSAVACEPRGSDTMVGALLTEPTRNDCAAGVIFFNNVSTLGMCGHGSIGLVATLAHLGRIAPGSHRIETPVGVVGVELHPDGSVSVDNVASYRFAQAVEVEVAGHGRARGDIAWGGNWFYLIEQHDQALEFARLEALTDYTWRVRLALEQAGLTGANGALIDHIELFAPSPTPGCDSRNFVLCPGKAYDRSPCGTGTSAKLACLAADGKLDAGVVWRQESIIGSVFQASYRRQGGEILPRITGQAWITAESILLLDPNDPFRHGIRNN